MAEETANYGFESDEVKVSPFNFGLNANKAFLKKFEWIPNGGSEGAEQEALDIVFTINEVDKSSRMFPITKAYKKGTNEETTDPASTEFKEAVRDFNSRIFHIVHCFTDEETYKATLSKKISSFKEFCTIVAGMLPKDFNTKPLDFFLQFQWNASTNQTRTFLEIPSKMKHGKFVIPAVQGTWEAIKVDDPTDDVREALKYGKKETSQTKDGVTTYTEFHPFTRTGWFMKSNFANSQNLSEDKAEETSSAASAPTSEGAAQNAPTSPVASW